MPWCVPLTLPSSRQWLNLSDPPLRPPAAQPLWPAGQEGEGADRRAQPAGDLLLQHEAGGWPASWVSCSGQTCVAGGVGGCYPAAGSAGRGWERGSFWAGRQQAGWLGHARAPQAGQPLPLHRPAGLLTGPPAAEPEPHPAPLPLLTWLPAHLPPACLQSVTDKLKEKLSGDEKEKVEKAVQAALDWMDENQVRAGLVGAGVVGGCYCLWVLPAAACGCWPCGCWVWMAARGWTRTRWLLAVGAGLVGADRMRTEEDALRVLALFGGVGAGRIRHRQLLTGGAWAAACLPHLPSPFPARLTSPTHATPSRCCAGRGEGGLRGEAEGGAGCVRPHHLQGLRGSGRRGRRRRRRGPGGA